jgi:oxygen-dependent protoporphyrinogen oxidase
LTTKHLLIVGGGIAGLSAAYNAIKKSKEQELPLQVTLVEAEARWGGKITTDRVTLEDGQFIIDMARYLPGDNPWGGACKELGLGDRLHGTNRTRKTPTFCTATG